MTGAYFSPAGVAGTFPDTLPACLTNFLYSVTSECLFTSRNPDVRVLSAHFYISDRSKRFCFHIYIYEVLVGLCAWRGEKC